MLGWLPGTSLKTLALKWVSDHWVVRELCEVGVLTSNQSLVDSHALLHAELIAFLRQHSPFADHRHLVLLAPMVSGLLLSRTVCFDHWKAALPLSAG